VVFRKGQVYGGHGRKPRPCSPLTIRAVPEPVLKLLGAAARRRGLRTEDLALQILTGVLYHGSIHHTLRGLPTGAGGYKAVTAVISRADAEAV
jgi:hypothetical protein